MSFQLIELKLEDYVSKIQTTPKYIAMGALSGNDMTTLKVTAVVDSISGGSLTLALEHSPDAGASWKPITTSSDGVITTTGTYSVWLTEASGIPSPNIRLKLTPIGGASASLSKLFRTMSTGDLVIPRSSGGGGGGTVTPLWPYAEWDTKVRTWTPGIFTELFTYKNGGPTGTSVALKAVVYTDSLMSAVDYIRYSPSKEP